MSDTVTEAIISDLEAQYTRGAPPGVHTITVPGPHNTYVSAQWSPRITYDVLGLPEVVVTPVGETPRGVPHAQHVQYLFMAVSSRYAVRQAMYERGHGKIWTSPSGFFLGWDFRQADLCSDTTSSS